ncbi:MAG TPA: LamG domain-containing protein, partial [Candidatus Aminicenantes bacterium]|nr:LamG domain-containing protein [Candidatus Aminicenantes bacterium]
MVKKAKIILSSVFVLFLMVILLKAQQPRVVAWWSFDQVREGKTLEVVGKVEDSIHGHYRVVKGVKGQALVFDGYTTCVMRSPEKALRLNSDFTLSAWVALGAYPWNWAPIVAQENTVSLNSNLDDRSWPEDIMVNSPRNGFYFGISPQGYLGLHLGGRGWIVCQSKVKIPLRQWTHVAAVVRNKNKIELYINGQKVEEMKLDSSFRIAEKEPIRLGMNRQKIEPSHPVRPFATLACWYSLDGLL